MPRESEPFMSSQEYGALRAKFHDDEANYDLLNGSVQHVRGRAKVWDTDYTLEKYTQSTDRLIGIMDGTIHERTWFDPEEPEKSTEKPDTVIFLDKSARPVSWFTDALWDQFAAEGAEKPESEFLNIDRVNWFVKTGKDPVTAASRLGVEDFDIDKVPDEDIERIRALYIDGELDRENWRNQIWNMPTKFDNKNILIVDEVKNKGGTLAIAMQVLKRAFPEATFSGEYFWKSGKYALGGNVNETQTETVPVWYDAKSSLGRGIGEVNVGYYEHLDDVERTDESFKRRIGASALSAPHFDPDTFEDRPPEFDRKALKLKQDIAFLSYGVADHRVMRSPDPERISSTDTNGYDAILAEQGLTRREHTLYRKRRTSENGTHGKAA